MHLKYDNTYTNRIFNVSICINNHVNSYMNCMLSMRVWFNKKKMNIVDEERES